MNRRTVKRSERVLSPWVRLVERTVSDGTNEAVYHSLAQDDYVSTVAVTPNDELVCVRQYRPAVDMITLELPGGLLGTGEDPLECAMRELAEETGLKPVAEVLPLGCYQPDTGRLENRIWFFFATALVPLPDWSAEPDVAHHLVPLAEIPVLIADGTFACALHIGGLGLALMRGLLPQLSSAPWPRRIAHATGKR